MSIPSRQLWIQSQELYGLTVMTESEVKPTSLEEVARLEELVITLLRKYIAKFYRIIPETVE